MKLFVGFLTYNEISTKYLKEFLPSLEKSLEFLEINDYQVQVFDNSSINNNSNLLLLRQFNQGKLNGKIPRSIFKYLSFKKNLGFSKAYNILINLASKARAKYFLIINPDILLKPQAIKELVQSLDNDQEQILASVAPKILHWDFVNNFQTKIIDTLGLVLMPGLRFVDWGQGQEDNPELYSQKIIGPSGAAGLFRLQALKKIAKLNSKTKELNYFDERFFMYKEDCDLAYRLFLAGYKSKLVPQALIYHDRTTASTGLSFWSRIRNRKQKSNQIKTWSFRNQHLIFFKYWKKQKTFNKFLILFYFLSSFIFSIILEPYNLKGYCKFWRKSK